MHEIEDIADALNHLYDASFGGKTFGRYILTLEQMRTLSGRDTLTTATEDKIIKMAANKHQLHVARIGKGKDRVFCVIKQAKMVGWRPASRVAVNKAVSANCVSHLA